MLHGQVDTLAIGCRRQDLGLGLFLDLFDDPADPDRESTSSLVDVPEHFELGPIAQEKTSREIVERGNAPHRFGSQEPSAGIEEWISRLECDSPIRVGQNLLADPVDQKPQRSAP